jgi:hypothetical protein
MGQLVHGIGDAVTCLTHTQCMSWQHCSAHRFQHPLQGAGLVTTQQAAGRKRHCHETVQHLRGLRRLSLYEQILSDTEKTPLYTHMLLAEAG